MEHMRFAARLSAIRFSLILAGAVCLAVFLSGCAGKAPETKTAVMVQKIEAAPPPSLPNECKPQSDRLPEATKMTAGGKTPPEAVEHANTTNIKRLNDNRITKLRCYCWQADNTAGTADKVEARHYCSGIQPPITEPAKPADKPVS